MRRLLLLALLSLAAVGCGGDEEAPANSASDRAPARAGTAPPAPTGAWHTAASGEGAALFLTAAGDRRALTLFCPAGSADLLVNVPAFRPVGSEERMSFGTGGTVVALVADTGGDALRGGVSGTAPLPAELAAILRGELAVNYGAQNAGPFAPPPRELSGAFLAGCRGRAAPPAEPPTVSAAHPCETQDGERLSVALLRAVGTEPFWGARIQGRCVTYSHPEDQQGTRIWTRYSATPGGGRWIGALGGQRFELIARANPGCSDGMSDERYPIAVELLASGERRRGCAEPL